MNLYSRNRETYNTHCYQKKEDTPSNYYEWGETYVNKSSGNKHIEGWNFKKPIHLHSVVEKTFDELAEKWKKETANYSTTLHITRNDNYIGIIALGPEVVPYILRDLEKETNHWFVALNFLTKENPVQKENIGKIEKMRLDWLSWGKAKKLI